MGVIVSSLNVGNVVAISCRLDVNKVPESFGESSRVVFRKRQPNQPVVGKEEPACSYCRYTSSTMPDAANNSAV